MNSPTEPTALQRQRMAFSYLREHAVNAHVAGDGLLANLLSHSGLDRGTQLVNNGKLLISLTELAWMPILAFFWLVNPSARYAVDHWVQKVPRRDDDDNRIIEWLTLHAYLVEQPLLSDAQLFLRIEALPWPSFFAKHSPEAETLLTHVIELSWFRGAGDQAWKHVVDVWKTRAPEWTHIFLAKTADRLAAQTNLAAPCKAAPLYPESSAEALRHYSPFAELWLLHLHGREAQVCTAVERLTPRISQDSHDWRVLGDFIHFNAPLNEPDESQNVHLARRRRLSADTPLLIFHDSREQRIDEALLELFRARSQSNASQRWEIFTLAMLHELSALRLWDFGMWIQAIRAQSQTTLESMQWTDASPELSAHGLILAVRAFATKEPHKDYLTRRAIDVLEFAPPSVLKQLTDGVLATYPAQKHSAAGLLTDLVDLLSSNAWPELARWTVEYARESAESRTRGWSIAPASHWFRALPALPIDSPVWTILQPEALAMARVSHCWQGGEAGTFLEYWVTLAPSPLAREVGTVLSEHGETHPSVCLARAHLLIELEGTHSELHGSFTRELLSRAHSTSEGLLLARHLRETDVPERERDHKQRMISLISDTVARATPAPTVNQHTFGVAEGVNLVESWATDDEPLLKELIAAVDSPNVLTDYLPWLIQTIQLMVAHGPVEFAHIVQPAVAKWTTNLPVGRSMFGQQSGPFSIMQFGSNQPEEIELMLGWLAFQLPRKLGTAAHENVLTWVRQMLLLHDVRPLEMAIYGSAVVTLQADDNGYAEALSLFETAMVSLWSRSVDVFEAGGSLASALRLLSNLIGSDTSDLLPTAEIPTRIRRLTPTLMRFLPRFVQSPRAPLRAAVAALLCNLAGRIDLEPPLSELLDKLKTDNRARVRFEAKGGWAARRKLSS